MPYGIRKNTGKEISTVTNAIVSVTLQDSKTASDARQRNRQTMAVKVNFGSATLANMVSWYTAFATQVDAASGGQLVDASIDIKPGIPGGLKTAPTAGSDVQKGGLYVFSVDGITYTYGTRLPAIDGSQLQANGLDIDPTATGSDALIQLLTGGATSPINIPATNDSWLALDAFLRGRVSTRK
jgi:hypothetical protein